MSLRSAPTAGDYFLLAALALMWGAAFLLIKIAVATVPPFTIVVGRLVIATILMMAYLVFLEDRLPFTFETWTSFALMGLFGNVVPFALIGWGEIRIDSGLAAILVATVPLFTAVLAHFFTDDEPLRLRQFGGTCLGLVGVAVLMGWEALAGIGTTILSQLAIIGAAFSYALTNIIARHVTTGSTASASAATLICATVWAMPASMVVDRPWALAPSLESLVAIAALAVFSTTIAYIVYFRLIRSVGATFVSFVNYLIPPIGVGLGIIIAGEIPSLRSLLALLVIFAGIAVARRA